MGKPISVHMSEGYQIRQRGIFNLDKLYKEMKSWFRKREYRLEVTNHSHKKLDVGDEILITWEAERDVTAFMRFSIKIKLEFRKIFPESDNLVSGLVKITLKAFIVPDYKEKWSGSKSNQALYNVYTKILYKHKIKEYWVKLDKELQELQNVAKEVLDFYR